jgi:hypothetical protein
MLMKMEDRPPLSRNHPLHRGLQGADISLRSGYAGKPSSPGVHALLCPQSPSKSLALAGKPGKIVKTGAIIVNPEQVIPMGDDDFKDFFMRDFRDSFA